ncbi:MAG: hypothetical protein DBY25_08635 [Clostridiales bacterium]|nr:MAG: hypothetical protein DBY25_08635 [Clostridiales bacterium]
MRKYKEYSIVYTIGSIGYGIVEVLWRGFTHWSMLLTGGFCMLWLYILNFKHFSMSFWKKCLAGTGIITAVEFAVGLLVNRLLHLDVWDYSKKRGNICGQVCLQYSFLWFLLCVPVLFFCKYLKKKMFKL